ncbi:MAG: hypothetical protein ACI88H_003352 [Cocleimonas sp.]|jgi:hypothetical protein
MNKKNNTKQWLVNLVSAAILCNISTGLAFATPALAVY